jgi:uncharacterized protein (TIGR02266 family)
MSPSDSPADQRKNPRLTAPKVVVRIPSVDRFRTHYLKDISEGGLFVKAEKVLPVGALLSLELWPPGWDEAVELSAKVIRSTDAKTAALEGAPCGMAVQFVSIPVEVDRQLKSLVEAYHGKEAEAPADPVGAQIEAMIQELAAARERLSQLETQLAESRGQAEAFSEQIHKLEREESEARASATQLGQERTELERKLKDATARAAAEQTKLKEQLDVARAASEDFARKLEQERDEARRQREAAAKASAAEQAKLKEQLDAGRVATEELTRKLEQEKGEGRKQREASAKALAAEQTKAKEQLDAARLAREEVSRDVTQQREEARQQRDRADRLTTELTKRETRESELKRLLSRVGSPRAEAPVDTGGGDDVVVVSDSSDSEETAEPESPEPDSPEPEGDDLDIDFGDLDLDDEIEAGLAVAVARSPILSSDKSASEAVPEGFLKFSASVKPKTRLMGRAGLDDRKASGAEERQIIELLGASPTFGTLLTQLEGKVSEERVRRFLFDLSREKLLELRD